MRVQPLAPEAPQGQCPHNNGIFPKMCPHNYSYTGLGHTDRSSRNLKKQKADKTKTQQQQQ